MEHVLLFDTSIGSDNVGDEIIMDFCQNQLLDMLGKKIFYVDKIPTHLEIAKSAYQLNKEAKYSIVCGTNILKTSILWKKNWKIGLTEALSIRNLCLMGAGWGNYNNFNTDIYTKWVYSSILSKKMLHSVRDSYTEQKLKAIGIKNVVNTACPTMWNLTPEFCDRIPTHKASEVVTALTFYKPDRERDRLMLSILHSNYKKVYLWLQQAEDYEYFMSLNIDFDIQIIRPLLREYDYILQNNEVDFVGSRLHGGIRALNNARRALIIGVDNRAKEIHKNTNIPYMERENMQQLDNLLNGKMITTITLPYENIELWKSQFNQ